MLFVCANGTIRGVSRGTVDGKLGMEGVEELRAEGRMVVVGDIKSERSLFLKEKVEWCADMVRNNNLSNIKFSNFPKVKRSVWPYLIRNRRGLKR